MPRAASARKRKTAAKSAERLAGKRIDQLEDSSASKVEKSRRKKRLLQGPEEFRALRSKKSALPKKKKKKRSL